MMDNKKQLNGSRKEIFIRFLYSMLYLVVFEILKVIVQITVVFQYIYLFVSLSHNDSVRNLSNKVAAYTYEVIRYLTLNTNLRPFPFNDFPAEIEQPVEQVRFR